MKFTKNGRFPRYLYILKTKEYNIINIWRDAKHNIIDLERSIEL